MLECGEQISCTDNFLLAFFNHRAKRGGSLFEGSSVGEEGSRSDPKFAWGARLRSLVFTTTFAPNVEIFG